MQAQRRGARQVSSLPVTDQDQIPERERNLPPRDDVQTDPEQLLRPQCPGSAPWRTPQCCIYFCVLVLMWYLLRARAVPSTQTIQLAKLHTDPGRQVLLSSQLSR